MHPRYFFKQIVILGTAYITSSHLNVTLLFLFGCGILQFTPIPQVRTKPYCSIINYSLKYYQ